jgi:DNA-binding LacI/PurR family transcriptional regulator
VDSFAFYPLLHFGVKFFFEWLLKPLDLEITMCDTALMPRKKGLSSRTPKGTSQADRSVSLKELAAHLELSPTTLSLVLNQSPAAGSIPKETKDRIFRAAKGFNYRPNFVARSLRSQRSYTLGVLVPELGEGYSPMVLSGVEQYLLREGYFYFVASHRHKPELIEKYPHLLLDRSIEGLIAIDTPVLHPLSRPVVAVSRHDEVEGVTNVVLNHKQAASLTLDYLMEMGHHRIAFIKGQVFSSDTQVRWTSIREAARKHGLTIRPTLVTQLEGDSPSPEPGYVATQKLLAAHEPFTALFAFNDISAIGAIRALRGVGYRVPEDVSVVGFDDVDSAAFHNPALTTVRQPLREMGRLAAETLLRRIANGPEASYPKFLTVEPELVIRQSTAKAPARFEGKRHAR